MGVCPHRQGLGAARPLSCGFGVLAGVQDAWAPLTSSGTSPTCRSLGQLREGGSAPRLLTHSPFSPRAGTQPFVLHRGHMWVSTRPRFTSYRRVFCPPRLLVFWVTGPASGKGVYTGVVPRCSSRRQAAS